MGLSKLWLFPSYALGFLDTQTLLVLILIVALVFGSARLPKLARSLREARDEFNKGKDEGPATPAAPAPPPAAAPQPPAQPTPPPAAAPPVDNPPAQE